MVANRRVPSFRGALHSSVQTQSTARPFEDPKDRHPTAPGLQIRTDHGYCVGHLLANLAMVRERVFGKSRRLFIRNEMAQPSLDRVVCHDRMGLGNLSHCFCVKVVGHLRVKPEPGNEDANRAQGEEKSHRNSSDESDASNVAFIHGLGKHANDHQ